MNPPLSFYVPGIPAGTPRPRAARMGGFIRIYSQTRIKNKTTGVSKIHPCETWKRQIHQIFTEERPAGWVMTGPVKLTLVFMMPRPKSHYNKHGALKPTAPKYATAKPDWDNLGKAVCDQLTDSGAWHDDAAVVIGLVSKQYEVAPNTSGCHVTIAEVCE